MLAVILVEVYSILSFKVLWSWTQYLYNIFSSALTETFLDNYFIFGCGCQLNIFVVMRLLK